jgi:hypothetical protein
MKKISSPSTFMMKKIFPLTWFGFIALFLVLVISTGVVKQSVMLLIIPIVMAVFGFFLMKLLIWDLMDEVIDYDDYLVVKYRGQEDVIKLNNIVNVNVTTNQRPPRVSLQLRVAGKFGNEVAFFPVTQFSLNPFRKNQVIEELITRIDKARSKNAV